MLHCYFEFSKSLRPMCTLFHGLRIYFLSSLVIMQITWQSRQETFVKFAKTIFSSPNGKALKQNLIMIR